MKTSKKFFMVMALGLCATVLSPAVLAANTSVTGVLSAGYTPTVGKTSDYLQGGWTVGGGIIVQPQPSSRFALQFDLSYSGFRATRNLIDLAQSQSVFRIDDGYGSIWSLTAAGRYTTPLNQSVSGYGLLGIGAYHRYIAMTQTAYGVGYICDPWWGYCYPGIFAGDLVVADTSQTKFGWNVGLGLEFPRRYGGAWFIEARYHWIDGSEATEYVPIQIGFRF
jgi:opacity protein-like surface antigen